MADTFTITADSLNLRQGPGSDHPVITELDRGTRVQRLEESGGWFRIQTDNGVVGWISAKYTAPDANAPAEPATPAQPAAPAQPVHETVTITADSLNVRQGAGSTNPVVTTLPKGTRVQRLEESDGWLRIQTDDGTTGWISARYAAVEGGSSSGSAAPAQPAAAPAGAQLRVTATTLNLRATPAKDGAVVTQLPHGMVVQQVEVSGDGEWTRVKSPGGFDGWVSSKYVVKSDGSGDPDAPRDGDPEWYAIAWGERGQKEHSGPGDNPRILAYQTACSYNAKDEDVPWCSSFANWVMKQAGIKGSGEASARSWLNWGQKLDKPRRGAITVLTRPGSTTNGHVTFYVGEENGKLKLLGGNQENQVKISYYDKSRLLSYRWPRDA
jgi:uncharacterized protein (TIGR02594 family)